GVGSGAVHPEAISPLPCEERLTTTKTMGTDSARTPKHTMSVNMTAVTYPTPNAKEPVPPMNMLAGYLLNAGNPSDMPARTMKGTLQRSILAAARTCTKQQEITHAMYMKPPLEPPGNTHSKEIEETVKESTPNHHTPT